MFKRKTWGLTLLEAVLVVAIFGMLGALLVSSLRMSLRSSQKIESHTIEGTSLSLFYVNFVREMMTSSLSSLAISADGRLLSFGGSQGINTRYSTVKPSFDRIVVYYFDEAENKLCLVNYLVQEIDSGVSIPVGEAVNLQYVDWGRLKGGTVEPVTYSSITGGWVDPVNLNSYVDNIEPQKVVLEHVESASFTLSDEKDTVTVQLKLFEKNDRNHTHEYTLLVPVMNPQ